MGNKDFIPADIRQLIKRNIEGWYALRHKEGWWVGDDDGVVCYKTMELARVGKTVLAEACREIHSFKIEVFTGANIIAGDFQLEITGAEAIKRIERRG